MQEGTAFLVGPFVVRAQQDQQVAFGLVGDHFDEIGYVFALGRESDDRALAEVSDFDTVGEFSASVEELRETAARFLDGFADFGVSDFEAAHGAAALLAAAAP